MEKRFKSTSKESVRMFKNDILEMGSKVHWSIPIFVYVPIVSFLFYIGSDSFQSIKSFLLSFSGLLMWTFVEYVLHRFVFHYEAKSDFGKKLHWLFHGVHHDYPNDAMRLVMPPGISLPLASLFYFLFSLIIPVPVLFSFFGFFLLGYLFYDMSHYAFHHLSSTNKMFMYLKRKHMEHHYKDPNHTFGVSSPLWDYIFKTKV